MTRQNNSTIGQLHHFRCLGGLIFYCCGFVLILSTYSTSASASASTAAAASLLSAEHDNRFKRSESGSDEILDVATNNDKRESRKVVDSAKRLIRASLWMEDFTRSIPRDKEDDDDATKGFDSHDFGMLEDDLLILLGASFDPREIESMIQDVRNELNSVTRRTIEGTENVSITRGECMASPPLPKNDNAYGSRMTGDRHAAGLLETVQDMECLEREFDVQNEDVFDVDDAIDVLKQCRILVLRNVLSKETTDRVFPHYIQYISDVVSGKLSSEGTTTFGGDYFILKEDDSRFNYMATKELVEQSTGLLDNEVLLEILSDPSMLGESMIVNHVGTIDAQPGADAQYWHADGEYVPSDDVRSTGFLGVGGHDLAPFAINMFTPLLPREGMSPEHGPTEFCLGTSHLKGHNMEEDLPVEDPGLLNARDGIVEHLQEFEWHIERGLEPPPHIDCPFHLHRIPLLKEGDVLLFDYMLTHRGGANNSKNNNHNNRSMIFATYSKKWFRDTNFDTDFGGGESGHRSMPHRTPLEELTRLTRFAVLEETGE